MQNEESPEAESRLAWWIVVVAVLCLGGTSACDTAVRDDTLACETFDGCTTLSGISGVRDEPFAVSNALVSDSVLYVAVTSKTKRFTSSVFTQDEVYILSRALAETPEREDQGWRMRRLSDSPDVESGGDVGRPMLATSQKRDVLVLWGELQPLGGRRDILSADVIQEAVYTEDRWSRPTTAYDLQPLPSKSLSGARLPAVMAKGPDERLRAVFRESTDAGFGRVEVLSRTENRWQRLGAPFGEETFDPWLAQAGEGGLVTAFLDLNRDHGGTGLMFSRSDDGGTSWSPRVKIADLGLRPTDSGVKVYAPRLIAGTSPGELQVVFPYDFGVDVTDGDPLPDQIWYSVSTDGGATWAAPAPVNPSDRGYAGSPVIRRDESGRVHLIYRQGPAFYGAPGERVRHAVWTGTSWQQQPDIGQRPVSADGGHGLAMAAGPDGCMHAVWDEYTDRESATSQFRYVRFGCVDPT